MWKKVQHSLRWPLVVAVAAMVLFMLPSSATASSPHQQAAALADLMRRIATCTIPPCIGTEAEVLYSLVRGQIATDGMDFFTEFALAFPGFAHLLTGVVMWDIDTRVAGMLVVLTGFHAAPAVVIAELEATQFECEEDDVFGEGQEEWECLRERKDDEDLSLDLYIGNGVLLVEIWE